MNRSQFEKVSSFFEIGRREGTIVAGGDPGSSDGWYLPPTIVDGVKAGARIACEEIFGPVLAVLPARDFEDGLRIANDSEYGLAAGLWTQNLDRTWRVGRAIRAGTIWINTYHHFYDEAEVGGFKRSGIGRQQGIEGLHEFTETKHLNFDCKATLW